MSGRRADSPRARRADSSRGRWADSSRGRRWVAIVAGAAAIVVGGAIVVGVAVASGGDGPGGGRPGGEGPGGDGPLAAASLAAPSVAAPSASAADGTGTSGAADDQDTTGFQDPAAPAAASDATPERVSIPAIGVDAALEDLHRGSAGELDPPTGWDDAGWFSDGIVPGAVGPAVIAGHVDSPTSAAVFFRLDELVAGDEIHVAMSDGSTRTFTVDTTERASKSAFPTSDVYGTTPTPTLRLITCDGTFDTATGHYTDNLIVFAELSHG